MPPTAVHWQPPRILSEHLAPLPEPLACLLSPGPVDAPAAVAALGARALLDLAPLGSEGRTPGPAWLAPHQVPAAERLRALLVRYGGGLLADAPGLGKSYVALAVALAFGERFALVVPAVLVDQWRGLLERYESDAPIVTHGFLSMRRCRPLPPSAARCRLFVVDEAHRFRNPGTNRYRALARLVVRAKVLLVTATPVHNRVGDLCHLLRLFLRDHALTALGVPSLRCAARGDRDADPAALRAAPARLCVSRPRGRARTGWSAGPVRLSFPARASGAVVRIGAASDALLERLVAGIVQLDCGGEAAALFRLLLLSQLASSLPAFRASLGRYEEWLELGLAATVQGRSLIRRDFRRLFPTGQDDLQLALLPLILPPGTNTVSDADRETVQGLPRLAVPGPGPHARRVGRIDRAGSPHAHIETVTFLPPPSLAGALAIERRWLAKARAQWQTGTAQIELAHGGTAAAFDWCDRLQELAAHAGKPAASGACAAVAAAERAVVLLVRLADQVEAVVVTASAVRSDPARATELLERAAGSRPVPLDRAGLELAIRRAAPLVRGRLDAIERAQWRGRDRDRLPRALTTFLFDLDGTLIDSIELILRSYRHTMRTHRGDEPADDIWMAGLGTPLWVQFRRFTDDPAEIDAMVATYRAYNLAHHDELVRPYDGIVEAVRALRERGRPLGLVTSKMRSGAIRGLVRASLEDAFDVVVGADEVTHPKPHPEPVRLALERLHRPATGAVFIGDSRHDIECGRAAGVKTAAALWGPFHRSHLEDLAPDYWLERPADLSLLAVDD